MNKKLFKTISFALVLTVLGSMCGCKKSASTGTGNEAYPGSPVTLNGNDIYPLSCEDTITYWKGINSDLGTKYENFGDTPIAKYIAKETGVKIEYIHPSIGGGTEQVQIMLASDELPDIVSHSWNTYPGGPQMAIKDDYIYSLNDIIDKYCPALKKILSENKNWDRELKSDEGNYYAFPQILEKGLLQVSFGPFLRGDWLEKLNMEAPTTIDEWEKVLTAFKNELGVLHPYSATQGNMLRTFSPAYGITNDWYLDGDTIKYGFSQPEYKNLLIKLNKWYKEGLINPDFISLDSNTVQVEILNGKTGATTSWAASGMGKMLSANAGEGDFTLTGVQFPAVQKGDNAEFGYLTQEIFMGKCVAISKNCKNVELAARLLDFGFTEKGHMMYCFGEEGKTYNMKDGYPTYTDVIFKNPDNFSISEALAAYTMNGNEPIVQDTRYIEQYYTQPELRAAQKEWGKTNMFEHMLPQLYVTPEQSDSDGDIMANVKTYVDEMTYKFIVGDKPIEEFDEYLEQLEKFRLSESVSYRQQAYERYINR